MSAFIVGHDHIHAIVAAGLEYGRPYGPVRWETHDTFSAATPDNGLEHSTWGTYRKLYRKLTWDSASTVGQILLDENIRSVDFRYSERNTPEPYHFVAPRRVLEPVAILKAINCLDYQSCETEDWHDSEAYAILQAIKNSAIPHLPGYDQAAWEIPAFEPAN